MGGGASKQKAAAQPAVQSEPAGGFAPEATLHHVASTVTASDQWTPATAGGPAAPVPVAGGGSTHGSPSAEAARTAAAKRIQTRIRGHLARAKLARFRNSLAQAAAFAAAAASPVKRGQRRPGSARRSFGKRKSVPALAVDTAAANSVFQNTPVATFQAPAGVPPEHVAYYTEQVIERD